MLVAMRPEVVDAVEELLTRAAGYEAYEEALMEVRRAKTLYAQEHSPVPGVKAPVGAKPAGLRWPEPGQTWFAWKGCPAELACLAYQRLDDDGRMRPTALCRACSKASARLKDDA